MLGDTASLLAIMKKLQNCCCKLQTNPLQLCAGVPIENNRRNDERDLSSPTTCKHHSMRCLDDWFSFLLYWLSHFFPPAGEIDYLKNGLPDWYEVVVFLCNALKLGIQKAQCYLGTWNRTGLYFKDLLTQDWCCCSCWCSSVSSTQGRSKLNHRDSVIRGKREGKSVDMTAWRGDNNNNRISLMPTLTGKRVGEGRVNTFVCVSDEPCDYFQICNLN